MLPEGDAFELLTFREAERGRARAVMPRADHVVVIFGSRPGSPALESRLRRGLDVFRRDPSALVVVSGDAVTTDVPEADAMRRWLVWQGVPPSRIVCERTARFTAQNARFVAPLVRQAGAREVTLVTERYHMARSSSDLRRALREQGLHVRLVLAPAPDAGGPARSKRAELKRLARDFRLWNTDPESAGGGRQPLGAGAPADP